MTTDTTDILPSHFAVVFFDDYDAPHICTGLSEGTKIDGKTYAIFDNYADAIAEFGNWPLSTGLYGILPMRLLMETKIVTTTTVKASVLCARPGLTQLSVL